MEKVTLGRSGICCYPVGLELEPFRKMSFAKCREAMDEALGAGIEFFDIGLPDEELQKRIGHGIVGRRSSVILAGSFEPCSPEELKKQLQTVLRGLKTDYLDLAQIHDPDYLPRTGDHTGFYDALMDAKEAGLIRSVGITTGTYEIALNALEYGWYDTLSYPWTKDADEDAMGFIEFSSMADMGTISVPIEEYASPEEVAAEIECQSEWDHHVILFKADDSEGMHELLKSLN